MEKIKQINSIPIEGLLPLLRRVKLRQLRLPEMLDSLGINYNDYQKIKLTNKEILEKEDLYNLRTSLQNSTSISEKEFCETVLAVDNGSIPLDAALQELNLTPTLFENLKRKYRSTIGSIIFIDKKGKSFQVISEILLSVGPIANIIIQELLLAEGISLTRQRISELVKQWERKFKDNYPFEVSLERKEYWQQKYQQLSKVESVFTYPTILAAIKCFQILPDLKKEEIHLFLKKKGIPITLNKVKSLIQML